MTKEIEKSELAEAEVIQKKLDAALSKNGYLDETVDYYKKEHAAALKECDKYREERDGLSRSLCVWFLVLIITSSYFIWTISILQATLADTRYNAEQAGILEVSLTRDADGIVATEYRWKNVEPK